MPQFRYKAVTDKGQLQQGQLEAASREQVVSQLQALGLIPLEVRRQAIWDLQLGRQRLAHRLVLLFTQQLAALLGAGITLDRALTIMRQVGNDQALASLLAQLQDGLRAGKSLSAVLADQQGRFDRFYLNLVQAAEATGALGQGLTDLAAHLERAQDLRDKTLSAFIYPLILLAVSGLSLLIILTYVVPQFEQLFADMGKALPLSTQVVIGLADALRHYGIWMLLALVLAMSLGQKLLADPTRRLAWDKLRLRLPLLGKLLQKLEMARFSRSLGTLMAGGVPLVKALTIAREVLQNQQMSQAIGEVTLGIKEGGRLAEPLQATGLFPALALQMIQVGEETGQLDQMLLKVASVYDREVETSLQRLLAVLEPAMIVGLGLFIAAIIMSILVAILSINELPL